MRRIRVKDIRRIERLDIRGKKELQATLDDGTEFVLVTVLQCLAEGEEERAIEWLEAGRATTTLNLRSILGYPAPRRYIGKDEEEERVRVTADQLGWVIGPALELMWTDSGKNTLTEDPERFSLWMPRPPSFR